MHRARYVQDTSASRRARAIYSAKHDEDDNNNIEKYPEVKWRHQENEKLRQPPQWDEKSVDSGFGSDLERRAAQLRIADPENNRPDDITEHASKLDDVRAPSRAKLTEEEKRKRTKARTLSTPGTAQRWHRCDDVTEDYSDNDDVIEVSPATQSTARSQTSFSRSNSLPSDGQHRARHITWNDVTCSDLRVLGYLGGGGYARVLLVEIKRNPGQKFALKVLNKQRVIRKSQVKHVLSEKQALLRARSRFIPHLFRTFQSTNHLYMITEACMGGDLFSVLEKFGALPHDVTRYVMACITEGLDHLHRIMGFIHRDIKTENILIGTNGVVKIGDLGFSKQLRHSDDVTHSFCGTAGYVAPEILIRAGHGRVCDFFSMGVVLFEIATCRSPFRRQCNLETHKATLKGIKGVAFPPNVRNVTVHIIRSLCEHDPRQRLGALGCEQVRRHEFYRHFDWERLRRGLMTSQLLVYLLRKHQMMSQPIQNAHGSLSYAVQKDATPQKNRDCWSASQKPRNDEDGSLSPVASSQDNGVWMNF